MKIAIIIYELLHFIAILIVRPEYSIQILPLSWYAAVPLAFMPVILAYLALYSKDDSDHKYTFLYIVSKTLMLPGYVAYIAKDIPYALAFGKDNNYYSLRCLFGIVLFLLIDAILIIILTIRLKRKKEPIQKSGDTL